MDSMLIEMNVAGGLIGAGVGMIAGGAMGLILIYLYMKLRP